VRAYAFVSHFALTKVINLTNVTEAKNSIVLQIEAIRAPLPIGEVFALTANRNSAMIPEVAASAKN
jgi:hypothetical protein